MWLLVFSLLLLQTPVSATGTYIYAPYASSPYSQQAGITQKAESSSTHYGIHTTSGRQIPTSGQQGRVITAGSGIGHPKEQYTFEIGASRVPQMAVVTSKNRLFRAGGLGEEGEDGDGEKGEDGYVDEGKGDHLKNPEPIGNIPWVFMLLLTAGYLSGKKRFQKQTPQSEL